MASNSLNSPVQDAIRSVLYNTQGPKVNVKGISQDLFQENLIDFPLRQSILSQQTDDRAQDILAQHLYNYGTLESIRCLCAVLHRTASSYPSHLSVAERLEQAYGLLSAPMMSTAEEDVYINRVPYYILRRLEKSLDAGDKWQALLAAIDEAELDGPPLEPGYVYVLENCFKRRQSPTETLLNELGQKGYKVRDLKHWLRLAGLNQALSFLEESAGGNPTTGFTSVSPSSYGNLHSYSGTQNKRPPVVHQTTTPTKQRAVGQTIDSLSSSLRNYTEGDEAPTEIKHRHNLMTPSSTLPPSSEEHTSGQSSTYSHTEQGTTIKITSNDSVHPHLGLIPSDISLSQVVSKIGGKYEEVAVLLGIPRAYASMQSGPLKGLDTLVYWRNGKSGPNFPTTWSFLLKNVEKVCGLTVAWDLEEALFSEPTWCDGNDIEEESFQKKYIKATIKNGGSVEVEIVKCVTLGPPEAGKTQLKRALTGNMKESIESTPVSTGAEVIMERYFDGELAWEPMGKFQLQSALHRTVDADEYNVKPKRPPVSDVSKVHVSIEKTSVTPSPAIMEDPKPEAGNDSTEELKEDLIEKFTKLQKKVLDNFSGSQGNRHLNGVRIIHFIDSGGQPSFFDLHPVISTSRAVYLIVYNSAEGLDAQPKITYRRPGDSPSQQKREIPNPKQTNLDLIKSSLFTLDHCTSKFTRLEEKARRYLNIIDIPTNPTSQLPAIIVGSRSSSRQHKTDDSDIIRRHCCHIPMCRDKVIGKVHFVESTKPMSGINELRDALKKVDCKFSIKRFPLKWFQCQLVFWSADDPQFFALPYSNLQALCQEGGFVSGDKEFRALVTTFHMLGIFSCPDLDLPDVDEESLPLSPVFTNPDVLFKQVTTLLEVPFLNPLEYDKNGPAIDKLQKSGIITRESLTLLGIPDTIGSFHGFCSYLLNFLLKWGLAAELKESGCLSGSGCGQLLHRELFIPSILLPRKDYNFALPPGFAALPSFALTILKTKEDDYCIPQGLFPHFIVNIMNRHEEGYLIKVARHEAEIGCRDVLAITKKANKGTELPYTIYVVDNIDHISVHITLARKGRDCTSCHSDCCTIVNDLKASLEKAYSHLFRDEGTSSVIIGCQCTCDEAKPCHLAQLDCYDQVLRCLLPDRGRDVEIEFCDTLKRIFPAHGSRKRSPPGPSTSVSSAKKKFTMYSDDRESPFCQALQGDSDSDIIDSADEFIQYVDKMIPNLELLGGALGVGNQAAAIVASSGTPHSKCIRILRAWFDVTPEPTWTKFCEKLEVSQAFAHLRSTIEKDIRERLKALGGSKA